MSSWTPHSFRTRALAKGCSEEFVDLLVEEGERQRAQHVPIIFTLRHLTKLANAPHGFVESVVRRSNNPYETFNITKRGKGRSYRQIAVPDPALLLLQRWIHTNILTTRHPHAASTAYARNCDPLENARIHAGKKWLVKLDITDFFEAISERQVYKVFQSFAYRPLVAFQLARICTRISDQSRKYRNLRWMSKSTRIGHLPQGAPTSPILANLVCAQLDKSLSDLARSNSCAYSRYADDIVFSTNDLTKAKAGALIHDASVLLGSMGFRRNRQKTHVCPPGARKIVTGLLVDRAEPRLPREFRKGLELHLHHAKKSGVLEHCKNRKFRSLFGFRAHLHGLVTYAEHVTPSYGAECRTRFDAIDWGDLASFPLFT
jgi:RNA-directed DNA polymerase